MFQKNCPIAIYNLTTINFVYFKNNYINNILATHFLGTEATPNCLFLEIFQKP